MLLLSPRLSDATFAKVAFDRPFETFFRNRNKNPGMVTSSVLADEVAHARNISVTTLGKQFLNKGLAAESFFFFKCI